MTFLAALMILQFLAGVAAPAPHLRGHTLIASQRSRRPKRLTSTGLNTPQLRSMVSPLSGSRRHLLAPAATKYKESNSAVQELPLPAKIIFNTEGIDIDAIPTDYDKGFLQVLEMKDLGISEGMSHEEQAAKIAVKRKDIVALLEKHGALHLKQVPMAKEVGGYQKVLRSLGFQPCQDPIGMRSARIPLGKGVAATPDDKKATTDLGFHIDRSDYTPNLMLWDNVTEEPRMPHYGAFVCLRPAPKGGAFRLLDGERLVRQLDRNLLRRLYEKRIRGCECYGVWLPQPIMGLVTGWIKEVLPDVFAGRRSEYLNPEYKLNSYFKKLPWYWWHIDTPPQLLTDFWRCDLLLREESPINRHPRTGEVVWFNNMDLSEMDKYRYKPKHRDVLGSRSSTRYSNGERITDEDMIHIEDTMDNITVKVLMGPGDIVFTDQYRGLHGRDKYENTREEKRHHAVAWGDFHTGGDFDTD